MVSIVVDHRESNSELRPVRSTLPTSLLSFTLCLILFPAHARTLYVDHSVSGTGDGLMWSTAFQAIGSALAAASAGDEIWVRAGVYHGSFTTRDSVGMYGGFVGTETIREQRDRRANTTILDGGRQGSVITVPPGAGRDTVIDGFTIQNGTGTVYNGDIYGGGVFCLNASPTFSGNIFAGNGDPRINGNQLTGQGGGLYCEGGAPVVTGNVFRGNIARSGAAIYCLLLSLIHI